MLEELELKLKKKLNKSRVLLLIAVLLLIVSIGGMVYILKGSKDFYQVNAEDLNEWMAYGMELDFTYGSFSEYTRNGELKYAYYAIDTRDGVIMGIKLPASDANRMDAIVRQSHQYYLGYSDTLSNVLRLDELYLHEMDSSTYRSLKMMLGKQYGFDEEMLENQTVAYQLEYLSNGYGFKIVLACVGVAILGFVLLIISFRWILYIKRRSYKKEFIDYIESFHDDVSRLDSDYRQAVSFSDIKVGQQYLYYGSESAGKKRPKIYAVKISEIIWVYHTTTVHRTNKIEVGKSYTVSICTKNQDKQILNIGSEELALGLINYFEQNVPGVIAGYSERLNDLFYYRRDEFLDLANEKSLGKNVMTDISEEIDVDRSLGEDVPEEDPFASILNHKE